MPELRRAERLPIASVQAYDLALKASALIARGINPPDRTLLSEAIALAQEAIAFDPLCHRAHYALSWAYCRRGVIGGIGPQPYGDLDHADAAALRLRELDESNHAAYAILGHIGMRRLRHEEALANLRRAHDLNPNDVTTLRWLSWEESNWGLADDAREHAELSIRLSPRDRLIDASYWTLALAAFVAGDCAGCITHAKKAIALNRQFTGYYLLVAACLAENAALEEARAAVEEIRRLTPGLLESRLEGRTYFAVPALADRYRRALERAAGLAAGQHRPDPPASRAGGLTDRERGVLSLIAQGLSNARIAAALDLSEHTVKRHVANILLKLDLPTRAAAVSWASKHGVL